MHIVISLSASVNDVSMMSSVHKGVQPCSPTHCIKYQYVYFCENKIKSNCNYLKKFKKDFEQNCCSSALLKWFSEMRYASNLISKFILKKAQQNGNIYKRWGWAFRRQTWFTKDNWVLKYSPASVLALLEEINVNFCSESSLVTRLIFMTSFSLLLLSCKNAPEYGRKEHNNAFLNYQCCSTKSQLQYSCFQLFVRTQQTFNGEMFCF